MVWLNIPRSPNQANSIQTISALSCKTSCLSFYPNGMGWLLTLFSNEIYIFSAPFEKFRLEVCAPNRQCKFPMKSSATLLNTHSQLPLLVPPWHKL